jgi:hypothetical protein
MKTNAAILYPEIMAMNPEGGMYVWIDPDEQSIIRIQALLSSAPFKVENTTGYHTTVLYHTGELPTGAIMPTDRPCSAVIESVILWPSDEGAGTVVLSLNSHNITDLHHSLREQGFTHTFPEYHPHLTVGTKVESSPALRLWMEGLNQMLSSQEFNIWFDPKLKGASNSDA